ELTPPDCIRFWVPDSGPGSPEAVQEEIFNNFTTYTSPDLPKGIGLGLAFCKLAVQAHDGKIWVESKAQQGSRFSFQIPTKQIDEEE
ncbi:MAG: HAMP domain-containing sensor histidine kinase, partial [Anaerolineaceae bacterium]|nr:HAMP domain-containing sensor histidine kinase [Anaerolineaceae bacterium]